MVTSPAQVQGVGKLALPLWEELLSSIEKGCGSRRGMIAGTLQTTNHSFHEEVTFNLRNADKKGQPCEDGRSGIQAVEYIGPAATVGLMSSNMAGTQGGEEE